MYLKDRDIDYDVVLSSTSGADSGSLSAARKFQRGFLLGALLFLPPLLLLLNQTYSLLSRWHLGAASIYHKVQSLLVTAPSLTIDVAFKDYQTLSFNRVQALKQGLITSDLIQTVPASVTYNSKKLNADLRLKGDWTEHLGDPGKWSFRVEISGGETLMGMRTFSLHHPARRNYIWEWLFHQALRAEGVLALRYGFVEVTLNGKDLGLYAIEEHFDKHILESQRRREGPIFKIDEEYLWNNWLNQLTTLPDRTDQLHVRRPAIYRRAELFGRFDVFNLKRISGDPGLATLRISGISIFEAYRQGKLPAHKIFDAEKMGRYLAICDLLGASHGYQWINFRFYYNPITALLEPIGFDGNAGQPIMQAAAEGWDGTDPASTFAYSLLDDQVIYASYLHNLARISDERYVRELLEANRTELDHNLLILYQEFPEYDFNSRLLDKNRLYLKHLLVPRNTVHAYLERKEENFAYMHVTNIHPLQLEVVRAQESTGLFKSRPLKAYLNPARHSAPSTLLKFEFEDESQLQNVEALELVYRIAGTDTELKEPVILQPQFGDYALASDLQRREFDIKRYSFLKVDDSKKTVEFNTSSVSLSESLTVPPGYILLMSAGSSIDLTNGAVLLSYSPVHWRGSESNPVHISSSDKSGGIAILGAKDKSILSWVEFSGLKPPKRGLWELPGAVTFYQSPVVISNCIFANSQGEDSLNIFDSTFTISETRFENSAGDALDLDFADGNISNSEFYGSKNDALDVSGSRVTVNDLEIRGAGDKGVSSGEHSSVDLQRAKIDGASFAIVSKDLSEVIIRDIMITNSKVGLAAFQKKPEFGPASLRAYLTEFSNVPIPYLLEEGSKFVTDGVAKPANSRDLAEEIYGSKSNI